MDIVTGGLPNKDITLTFMRQEVIGGAKNKGGKVKGVANGKRSMDANVQAAYCAKDS